MISEIAVMSEHAADDYGLGADEPCSEMSALADGICNSPCIGQFDCDEISRSQSSLSVALSCICHQFFLLPHVSSEIEIRRRIAFLVTVEFCCAFPIGTKYFFPTRLGLLVCI
jgi:hypothetical protein